MNARGRSAGGERAIGEVIAEFLNVSGLRRRMRQGFLVEAWEAAVGADIARQARICDFRRNQLRVEVSSSSLLQELAGFRKAALLEALNGALDGVYVRDIRFQLAKF